MMQAPLGDSTLLSGDIPLAVIYDFDDTLYSKDTDSVSMARVDDKERMVALYRLKAEWKEMISETLHLLQRQGTTPASLRACYAQYPLNKHFKAMVTLWAAKGVPQFIVSDANALFIGEALAAHGIAQHFPPHHIYTNPAEYLRAPAFAPGPRARTVAAAVQTQAGEGAGAGVHDVQWLGEAVVRVAGVLWHAVQRRAAPTAAQHTSTTADVGSAATDAAAPPVEWRWHPVLPGAYCCSPCGCDRVHPAPGEVDTSTKPTSQTGSAEDTAISSDAEQETSDANADAASLSGHPGACGYWLWHHHLNNFTDDISPVNMCKAVCLSHLYARLTGHLHAHTGTGAETCSPLSVSVAVDGVCNALSDRAQVLAGYRGLDRGCLHDQAVAALARGSPSVLATASGTAVSSDGFPSAGGRDDTRFLYPCVYGTAPYYHQTCPQHRHTHPVLALADADTAAGAGAGAATAGVHAIASALSRSGDLSYWEYRRTHSSRVPVLVSAATHAQIHTAEAVVTPAPASSSLSRPPACTCACTDDEYCYGYRGRLLYFGDGGGDITGTLMLRRGDIACLRYGYRAHAHLTRVARMMRGEGVGETPRKEEWERRGGERAGEDESLCGLEEEEACGGDSNSNTSNSNAVSTTAVQAAVLATVAAAASSSTGAAAEDEEAEVMLAPATSFSHVLSSSSASTASTASVDTAAQAYATAPISTPLAAAAAPSRVARVPMRVPASRVFEEYLPSALQAKLRTHASPVPSPLPSPAVKNTNTSLAAAGAVAPASAKSVTDEMSPAPSTSTFSDALAASSAIASAATAAPATTAVAASLPLHLRMRGPVRALGPWRCLWLPMAEVRAYDVDGMSGDARGHKWTRTYEADEEERRLRVRAAARVEQGQAAATAEAEDAEDAEDAEEDVSCVCGVPECDGSCFLSPRNTKHRGMRQRASSRAAVAATQSSNSNLKTSAPVYSAPVGLPDAYSHPEPAVPELPAPAPLPSFARGYSVVDVCEAMSHRAGLGGMRDRTTTLDAARGLRRGATHVKHHGGHGCITSTQMSADEAQSVEAQPQTSVR